jgi:hypothetical protein
MPLQKLQFRPGINRDVTSLSNEGGWVDGDKIRFRLGYPEKLGGWSKYSGDQYLGSVRSLHNWIALDGSNYLGLGSHLKYYVEEGGTLNDITPIRATAGAGNVTFEANRQISMSAISAPTGFDFGETVTGGTSGATARVTKNITGTGVLVAITSITGTFQVAETVTGGTSGTTGVISALSYSDIISVQDVNHGAVDNDFVIFSGTDSLGGNVTDAILDAEHQIIHVEDSGNYEIQVSVTANASDTGDGNASSTSDAEYQINVGLDSMVGGTGWGSSTWGRGTWGSGSSVTTTTELRLWSEDNFGEDLLINPVDSGIYYWDKGTGLSARAVELSAATTGAASGTKTSVPQVAKQILVSDTDRHVIAFGCDGLGASSSATQGDGIQDPLLIRFSSQENPIDWFPTSINTAGDLIIGSGSQFVQALETKREILVWTDASLHSMRFIGPPYTFGITQLASNTTIMSPNSAVATEDFVFWMGLDNFYVYAGQTQQLDCPVKDKVFQNFNFAQADKVFAGVNSEYNEVFWFYPSQDNALINNGDGQNDKYVIYNYKDQIWYFGNLARTAWIDRGVRTYPIAVQGGYIYNHEFGYDDDGSVMDSFIESAPMDLDDGDRFTLITKLIPDITFAGSTNISTPQATFSIKARNNPGVNFLSTSSGIATRTSTVPVEEYTEQLNLRARGRSFAFRVDSSTLGSKWKLGTPRVDLRPDGRR